MRRAATGLPRRILLTADTVGGVWQYALELAAGLQERGVATVLATLGPVPSAAQRRQAETVPELRLESKPLALEWMPDAERDFASAGAWLLDLVRRHRVDLVHLNGVAHADLPWPVPTLVVAHSSVCTWWRAVRGEPPPPAWEAYGRRTARGLAAADVVVAPTAAFLDSLRAVYGPLPHARVIRNGRTAPASRLEARDKEPFIFAAGRVWDEAKNLSGLDSAAAGLGWPVRVAGDMRGPDGTTVALPNAECLGVLGPESMADYFRRAAIFASPARYEPFGLAVLEAAQSGCALVLSDIPSFRELWGGAAELVPADDPVALHRALAALIADPARRGALARAALVRAAGYGSGAMIDAYASLYAELCRGQVGAARGAA